MSIYFRFICEQIQFKKLTDFSTIILEDQFSVIFFQSSFYFPKFTFLHKFASSYNKTSSLFIQGCVLYKTDFNYRY